MVIIKVSKYVPVITVVSLVSFGKQRSTFIFLLSRFVVFIHLNVIGYLYVFICYCLFIIFLIRPNQVNTNLYTHNQQTCQFPDNVFIQCEEKMLSMITV